MSQSHQPFDPTSNEFRSTVSSGIDLGITGIHTGTLSDGSIVIENGYTGTWSKIEGSAVYPSELPLPERDLDYTIVFNQDKQIKMSSTKNSKTPILIFGSDMFLFDLCFNREDKEEIYRMADDLDSVNFIALDGYKYRRSVRRNIESLYSMIDTGSVKAKPYLVNMVLTPSQEANRPLKYLNEDRRTLFNKSGFHYKTENDISMYDMIEYVNGVSYVISVVSKGFISKELTMAIRRVFLHHAKFVNKSNLNYPEEFHFFEPKNKYPISKCLIDSTTMYNFKNGLAYDLGFINAVSKLTSKNLIVNIHVLDKNLI